MTGIIARILCYLLAMLYLVACGSITKPNVIIENDQGTPVSDSSIPATATPTPPANLVENGNFQRNWDEGWDRYTGDTINGQSVTEVFTTSTAESGKAVRLIHSGTSELSIYQHIVLPTVDSTLRARINVTADNPCLGIIRGCSGFAGLMISLHQTDNFDESGGELFWSYVGRYSDDEYFPSTGTRNFVFIEPGWTEVSFNVRQTIVNRLPDVDADNIEGLTITLFAGSVGECQPGECYAEVQAADIELMPNGQ